MRLISDWLPVFYIALIGIVGGIWLGEKSANTVLVIGLISIPIVLIGLYVIFRLLDKQKK